jgi:L-rhamnose-H+ transport protein
MGSGEGTRWSSSRRRFGFWSLAWHWRQRHGVGDRAGRPVHHQLCLVAALNWRNRCSGEYLGIPAGADKQRTSEHPPLENPADAPSTEMALEMAPGERNAPSLGWNYLFSEIAGATRYMQFSFHTMGETQMGRYKFSNWTLHMASIIIIFSTFWGIALKEWRAVSAHTETLVFLKLLTLVGSTMIVGDGNYLGSK